MFQDLVIDAGSIGSYMAGCFSSSTTHSTGHVQVSDARSSAEPVCGVASCAKLMLLALLRSEPAPSATANANPPKRGQRDRLDIVFLPGASDLQLPMHF